MIQAIIVLTIGIPGLLINFCNIYVFSRKKSMLLGTPYGYLTISRCIANAYVLLTFICYVAPANIAKHTVVSDNFASHVGVLTSAPTGCIIAIQLFLALQRFFAVYKPALYQKSLHYPALTVIQICIPWTWGILVTIFWEIASMCSSCSYSFDEEMAAWGDDCPPSFTLYTITVPVYISTATVFLANVLILLKLKTAGVKVVFYYGTQSEGYQSTWLYILRNRAEYANNAEKRRNDKRVNRIVLQGICQDTTFLVETFMFNYAGAISDSIMWWFACYSLAWELSHAVDGLIIFLFNARITSKGSSVPTTTKF